MPRTAAPSSLEDLLRAAMAPVLRRVSADVARAAAELAAKQLDADVARSAVRGRGRGRGGRPAAAAGPRSRPRVEITRWVPDRRARRVPRFVIEATGGLDTKKKIVARFGPDAVFEKGRPLPRAKG